MTQVQQDSQGKMDQEDHLGTLESRDLSAKKGPKEQRVILGKEVLMDLQENQVIVKSLTKLHCPLDHKHLNLF